MTSKSDNGPKHASRPPRKPVTIDLEAKDVTEETPDETPSEPKETSPEADGPTAESAPAEPQEKTTDPSDDVTADNQSDTEDKETESVDAKVSDDVDGATSDTTEPETEGDADTSPAEADETPHVEPAAKQKKASGIVGWMAAALAGGVVALGGGYGLQQAGVLPGPSNTAIAESQSALDAAQRRIAALEEKIGVLADGAVRSEATPDTLAALDTRVAKLESAPAPTANNQATADLSKRIDALDATVKETADTATKTQEAASAASSSVAALSQLPTEVAELRKLVSTGAAGSDVALESLQSEIATLRAKLGEASSEIAALTERPAADPALSEKITGLEATVAKLAAAGDEAAKRVDELSTSLTQAQSAPTTDFADDIKTLSERLTATEASDKNRAEAVETLAATTGTLTRDAEAAAKKLDEISTAIATATTRIDEIAKTTATTGERLTAVETELGGVPARETAARAVAVAALSDAVDAGRPYETELAAVARVLGEGADLSLLKSHAASGIPTRAALSTQFAGVAEAILATATKPADDGDLLDKFLNSARSAVRVRSTGDNGDAGTDAIVARMERAVAAGDFQTALNQADALPDAAKTAAAEWTGLVQARLEADTLMRKVSADVLALLAGPGN